MRTLARYTYIKRFLLKYPKVREWGASFFLLLPLPLSKYVYRAMRRYVFKDNAPRLPTFEAAFRSIAQSGIKTVNYLEYGVARGTSLISAYDICTKTGMSCNLFAFDSFQGLPGDEGGVFAKGDYSYPETHFKNVVKKAGVPMARVKVVRGFYEQSLTPELITALGFKRGVYCIHIDSDLYESAKTVLNWLEPILDSGSVIIFDDWFAFDHMPDPENYGEQKALREWKDCPNWTILHKVQDWNIAFIRK
jgi:O-methyltransferase